ncbi:MAG: phosphoribosyltransferase family protein [Bacteroidia bacterium]|nr:phosphoribosyltransferase family protein [Bacteroidia bacterium]MDW8157719.1 phosphoribosyltransferase family protein [Bacteroidia bacterium]
MQVERLWLYTIQKELGTISFNVQGFSKFKYGSTYQARQYGLALAKLFFKYYARELLNKKTYITCSAYKTVPNAAYNLMSYVQLGLNHYLYHYYKAPPIDYEPLRRETLYEADYGKLSFQEREMVMQKNLLYINEKAITKTQIILVDDIRVTGLHEDRITVLLEKCGVEKVYYLYVINANVAEPSLEHELNHAFVKRLCHLKVLMQEEDYQINSRVCRFLLAYHPKEELSNFFKELPPWLLEKLYSYFLADGYNTMPNYQEGFKIFFKHYSKQSSAFTLLQDFEAVLPP